MQQTWMLSWKKNGMQDPSKTVKDALVEKVAVIGENLKSVDLRKVVAENGMCSILYPWRRKNRCYVVDADTTVVNDAVKEALTNIAMQIAALNPKYVSRDEVSADYIAHEKEILLAQIMNDPKESQKPEKVIHGMIEGRISKELKRNLLSRSGICKSRRWKTDSWKILRAGFQRSWCSCIC